MASITFKVLYFAVISLGASCMVIGLIYIIQEFTKWYIDRDYK